MKTALLVDTNRAAVPLYESLRSEGIKVSVVGSDPNEPLAKIAKEYICMDYSDINSLHSIINRNKYDYLIPGCTDLSYEVCARISNGSFRNIESSENNEIINDKVKFRKLCATLNVPSPSLLSIDDVMKKQSVIVKPADSFSGKGISIVKEPTLGLLDCALKKASSQSKSGAALIEEYVEGQLFSYSCFIVNKKVEHGFFVQENCAPSTFAVNTSRVREDIQGRLALDLKEKIELISERLSLVDGLLHVQFILNSGRYWLVEMTRRCPGDLYSLLIEMSTGFPYSKSYVSSFIGKSIPKINSPSVCKKIIRHTITQSDSQYFWGLQFKKDVHLKLFVPLVTTGNQVQARPSNRIGIIFTEYPNEESISRAYDEFLLNRVFYLGYKGGGSYE